MTRAITLTTKLAYASGLDAGKARMRKAARSVMNDDDADLATTVTNRLMLFVPFEQGGLGGLELPAAHIADLGLTVADVLRSGNRVAGHNGGPALDASKSAIA